MNLIFTKLLAAVGWQWLLEKAWSVAYPALVEQAKKSQSEVDDKALEVINEVMKVIIAKKD